MILYKKLKKIIEFIEKVERGYRNAQVFSW